MALSSIAVGGDLHPVDGLVFQNQARNRVFNSVTILAPQTMGLSAFVGVVAGKAGKISLGLLNCPYQFSFIGSAGFEVMLFGNFFDLAEFHL
jgi:hypothetical protein